MAPGLLPCVDVASARVGSDAHRLAEIVHVNDEERELRIKRTAPIVPASMDSGQARDPEETWRRKSHP